MDFENLQADVNMILPTHYSSGRSGCSIDKVILHHNMGDLSVESCYNIWLNREASAHYQVESSGRIGQLVNDWDTAWHAGDWDANCTSIGIEHADCCMDPYRISDECAEAGAHLTAAICLYYNLGRPTWGINVFGHSDFQATACPASLKVGGADHDRYMNRAQEWYDAMLSGTSASGSIESSGTTENETYPNSLGQVNVSYALRKSSDNQWWDTITNFNNDDENGYAGAPYESHNAFKATVDNGSIRYKVHEKNGEWTSEYSDGEEACVDGSIDGVAIYYVTPNEYAYQQAWYRSQTVDREGYLAVCCDYGDSVYGYDGWAGYYGEDLDRIQVAISESNPF